MPDFDDDEYEIKILLAKPSFHDAISALRGELGIAATGFADTKAQDDWDEARNGSLNKILRAGIEAIISDFKLSYRWRDALYLYLLTGNKMFLRTISKYELKFEHEGEDSIYPANVKVAWIRVDADTTQREVIVALRSAKRHFKTKKKRQPIPNFERDDAVRKKYQQGMQKPEIAEWLNANFPGAYNTDDIASILKRRKKRLK